jgi:hypothetical protein
VAIDHTPSNEGNTDWRRHASDRNVSHGVARALWEHAHASAPDDPAQAEHAFHLLLEEAEAANITHEPGRETLSGSTPGARDAGSLGPGKSTRVLLEQPRPPAPAGSAPRGSETGKPRSADELRDELRAAGQAGKNAAAMLAASDPATIVEALRQLRGQPGSGVLQTLLGVAGGAVERFLAPRSQAPQTQQGGAAKGPNGGPIAGPSASPTASQAAQGTPDRVHVTQPADRRR